MILLVGCYNCRQLPAMELVMPDIDLKEKVLVTELEISAIGEDKFLTLVGSDQRFVFSLTDGKVEASGTRYRLVPLGKQAILPSGLNGIGGQNVILSAGIALKSFWIANGYSIVQFGMIRFWVDEKKFNPPVKGEALVLPLDDKTVLYVT